MTTSTQTLDKPQPTGPGSPGSMPLAIPASIAWNLVILVASILVSRHVFGLTEFLNLGRPVQSLVGVVALIPAVLAVVSSLAIWQRRSSRETVQVLRWTMRPGHVANLGRYIAIAMYFVGFVLALALLAHQWGLYGSFEHISDGIISNAPLTLGFVLAYGLYWLAGRFREFSRPQIIVERVGLAVGGMTLIALLLASNVLGGANYVLSTYSDPITWLVTGVAVVFGFLAFRLLKLSTYFNETPDQRTAWQGWLMLSPNIIGFMLFFAGPLLLSLYLSFTDSTLGRVPAFTGLQNYGRILALEVHTQADLTESPQRALSFGYNVLAQFNWGDSRVVIGARDAMFWLSLRNTLMFCLLLLPLAILPALVLSLILNSKLPGMKFFRAVYFLPSVAAVVGTALIWRWLYTPTIGYYNYAITSVVNFVNSTFGTSIEDPRIQWLTDPGLVLISMVFLSAWGVVGYNTVLFLAGLQGVPRELYEAAMIDGANRWRQFLNVTLPMIAPTTFFVVITTVVTGLQVFNEPYALFPSRPLPVNATTSVFYLYERGFARFEFGYASSIAWMLFLIIFSITLLQFRLQRKGAYDS
jgi:ABC-type sugar transport system permease subunit